MVNSFSLFLAPILLASTLVPSTLTKRESASTVTTIPLQRRSEQVRDIDTLQAHVEHLKAKHILDRGASKGSKKRANLLLNNINDSHFTGQILVGTPPKKFNVLLDTGSRDLVIVNTACNNCPTTTPLYNATSSSTSKVTTIANVVTYGTSQATGVLVTDTVSIAGLSYTAQSFTSCTSILGNTLTDSDASGILGLGLGPSFSSSNAYGIVESLSREGLLHEQVFGFAFEPFASINTTLSSPSNGLVNQSVLLPGPIGGVMTVGGTNTFLYSGSISWNPVNSLGSLWQIPLQDISLGGKSLGISSTSVVIDTGASIIGGPSAAVSAIYAKIPGSQNITYKGSSGFYSYPCNSTVNMALKFGNVSYPIPSRSFAFTNLDGDSIMCLGALVSLQDAITTAATIPWIVGDTFLINVYSAYRYGGNNTAVGFAMRGSGGTPSVAANSTFVSRTGSGASTIQVKLFNPSWIVVLGLAVVLVAV